MLAARCNPDPPPCSVNRADAGPDPVTCPANQVPACLSHCVPAIQAGSVCDRDPCVPNARVCGDNLACVPVRVPNGGPPGPNNPPFYIDRCVARTGLDLLFCNGDCATGAYCRDIGICGGPRPGSVPRGYSGQCVLPVREGGQCDANWETRTGSSCLVCEPGMECAPDPRYPTGTHRTCLRRCSSSGDCSCDVSTDPSRLDTCDYRFAFRASDQHFYSTCTACSELGESCVATDANTSGWGCCDPRSTCDAAARVCCIEPGNPVTQGCASSAECCARGTVGGICAPDGVCHACGRAGEAPDPLVTPHCCSGVSPLPGETTCPTTCELPDHTTVAQGQGCQVPQATLPGIPATGVQCAGSYTCSLQRGGLCAPTRTSVVEICNGIDDNCDGQIDEGLDTHAQCMGPVLGSGEFAGCSSIIGMGTQRCAPRTSGAPPSSWCDVHTGFCAIDAAGVEHDGSVGTGSTCFTHASGCQVEGGNSGPLSTNSLCDYSEVCCSGDSPSTTCQTRTDIRPGVTTCWAPGDLSTVPDGACSGPDTCSSFSDECPCLESGYNPMLRTGCGWCRSTNSCTRGTLSGPVTGSCADWSWQPTGPCSTLPH